jgi:penicillin-binding protein 2
MARIDTSDYAGTHFIGKGGVEKAHEGLLHGRVGHQQVEVNARGGCCAPSRARPRCLAATCTCSWTSVCSRPRPRRWGTIAAPSWRSTPATAGCWRWSASRASTPISSSRGSASRTTTTCCIRRTSPCSTGRCAGSIRPDPPSSPSWVSRVWPPGWWMRASTKYCPGFYQLPGQSHRYRCWRRGGHGSVALEQAVVQSCDVYFYDLAHDLGIERLQGFLGASALVQYRNRRGRRAWGGWCRRGSGRSGRASSPGIRARP